jgi:hypothetical protein
MLLKREAFWAPLRTSRYLSPRLVDAWEAALGPEFFLLNSTEPDARVRGPHRLDLPFHHRLLLRPILLLICVRPQSLAGSLPPPSALLLPSPLRVMRSTPSLSLLHHRLARLLRRREPALLRIRRHHRRICLPHDRRPTRAACDAFRRRRQPTPCKRRTAVEARNGSRARGGGRRACRPPARMTPRRLRSR